MVRRRNDRDSYVSRNRHHSGPIPTPSLKDSVSDVVPDRRWLSSERLVEPWVVEDRWWLAGRHASFLDTDSQVFGRKQIFLVDRKKSPKSESDIGETKTGDFDEAVKNCSAALQIDMNSVKALYIRSVAYMNLQNISEAMADCKQAIILSPQDRAMREHWDLLKTK